MTLCKKFKRRPSYAKPFCKFKIVLTEISKFNFLYFRSMTSKEVQKSSSLQLEVQLTKILEPSQCNPVSV